MTRIPLLLLAAAEPTTAPGGAPPPSILSFGPMILIFVIMYLLLIRPQQKKAKEHRELLSQLKAGDSVITNGGIHGTITAVKDRTLMVKIADNVVIEVARGAIATLQGKQEG